MTIQDRTAVVGIGQTELAKSLPQPELQLACEAIKAALDDAQIGVDEVDGLALYSMEDAREVQVARNLGMQDITFFGQVGYGGGAGPGVLGTAAIGVATGQCEVAVAWRARKRGARTSRPWAQARAGLRGDSQWSSTFGMLRPVDQIAMLARRYMHEFGLERDHLASVAMAVRAHANNNPVAMMRDKPMSRDDYMQARWVSKPLCLFDNCLETDGALAAVVVSADRAKDLPHKPVYIHSYAQGFNSQHQVMTNYHRDDPLTGPAWACAKRLWANAAFGPEDVDVAQLYDAFSPLIPLSLEGYGFVPRGEAKDFIEDEFSLQVGGALPTNTSGGGMSEAYVHGFNLITEGVKQIRGTSTNQVEGAETCLVTGGEGVPTSAVLLRG